jgi:uncharacterized membrane protein YedE/YeeE
LIMDMFTPVTASIGGALIGLSAVMLMLLNGRIAGISGILSGIALASPGDKVWRILFVTGLIVAPVLVWLGTGVKPAFQMDASWPVIILGGLCVGFGTRLGSGCTSGHGVCGLSRLSKRSLVSVVLFMGAGMATVAILNLVLEG